MASYKRTALFRDNAPLSCVNATSVSGFEISGIEPTNTERRIVFSYSGDGTNAEYFKLAVDGEGNATPQAIGTQNITAESVLLEGNTVADLESAKSVPDFVGKTIYPVIALSAPEEQTAAPTVKLGIITGSNTALYERYEESAIIELSDTDVDIISLDSETETSGGATANIQVKLKTNSTWGEYTDIKNIKNAKASAVQFRGRYTVGKLDGTATAEIKSVSMVYSGSDAKLSGETTELALITKHFAEKAQKGLIFSQAMIRHKKLQDAEIRAFVSFRSEVQERNMLPIGTGTGERQTISLPDTGIAYNTVSVQVNGETVRGYSLNTETNEITITAEKGLAITASYEYGWQDEEWQEMTLVTRQAYNDNIYASKYQLGVESSDTDKTVTCIKFSLDRVEGDVKNKILAVGTGDVQVFQLDHYAQANTLECSGVWTYDEATRILKVQHAKGENIIISYHWVSESHEVYAVAAGWAKSA